MATAPTLILSQPNRRVHVTQSTSPSRVEVRPKQNIVQPKPRNTRVQVLSDLAGIVQSLNSRLLEVITDGGRQSQVAPLTTGDTSNYILRTFGAPILTLYDGLGVWFTPHLSNAAPPVTLRVDSTGTQDLKLATRDGITPLPANTLRMGTPTIAFWDSQENAWIVGTAMAELTQEQLDVLDLTLAQANDASSLAQLAQQSAEAATNTAQGYRDAAQGYRDEAQAIIDGADLAVNEAIVAWAADANSAFGQLESYLNTNYYTITTADAAISNATTTLQSTLEDQIAAGDSAVQGAVDALNATLTTDYYTITSADAAISNATTTLQSTLEDQIAAGDSAVQGAVDALNATLTADYYTIASADVAISQALTNWAADATSPFGVLAANLGTNYYTSADTNQAIAGAVTTLETSLTNDLATLSATLQNDYYTTTTTDSVIAAAIQQFDTGAANVTSIQSAVSDITGYAEATASFQVGANGEVSLLELVAFNQPGGVSYSLAKISADDILLDGSVKAPKLDVDELSAISANIGTFQSAPSGERIVIEDDRISVYDSSNTLRVRMGRL